MGYNNKEFRVISSDGEIMGMLRSHFTFNYKKVTQGLNSFALKEGGRINKMKALKLVYIADRYHLRKYGRLITNDTYFAMNYGPVPSGAKDIAEASEVFLDRNEGEYSSQYIISEDNLTMRSLHPVDEVVFSESDIEALEFAWATFGHFDQFQLADYTHHYPEWKRHEQSLKSDSRILISLEDFFNDPAPGIEQCFVLSEDDKSIRREQLAEMSRLENLWR
jgi:uncharacterized phage-associated protein